MARSSRMCGSAGSSPEGVSRLTRGGRNSRKCTLSAAAALQRRARAGSPHPPAGRPETPPPRPCRRRSCPRAARRAAARRRCRAASGGRAGLRLARGPERGERHHLHLGARERRARDRRVRDQPQDRLQPVVAGVVQVIGLGGREQQAVDAARQDGRQPGVRAGPEALQDALDGALQVGERARPAIDGGERVDQHDLAVEAREVIAEERLDDVGLVALEAALEHGAEAAARDSSNLRSAAAGRR